MIIGLIGAERVGKDTLADILVVNFGFKKHSMAEPIREISNIIFPYWFNSDLEFTVDKDCVEPKSGICPREFMKWLGTDIFQFEFHRRFPQLSIPDRSIWSVICYNKITHRQKLLEEEETRMLGNEYINEIDKIDNWVIPDVRFIHEAEQLAKLGCHFIYIVPGDDLSGGHGFNGQSIYDIPDILKNYHHEILVNNKSDGLPGLTVNIKKLLDKLNVSDH